MVKTTKHLHDFQSIGRLFQTAAAPKKIQRLIIMKFRMPHESMATNGHKWPQIHMSVETHVTLPPAVL